MPPRNPPEGVCRGCPSLETWTVRTTLRAPRFRDCRLLESCKMAAPMSCLDPVCCRSAGPADGRLVLLQIQSVCTWGHTDEWPYSVAYKTHRRRRKMAAVLLGRTALLGDKSFVYKCAHAAPGCVMSVTLGLHPKQGRHDPQWVRLRACRARAKHPFGGVSCTLPFYSIQQNSMPRKDRQSS